MKWMGRVGLAALLVWAAGCVPLGTHRKLEQRFEEQETYVVSNKDKVREMERREQALQMQSRQQEKQLALLNTRLEKSERLRQRMEENQDQSLFASAPISEVPPTVMGLEVNPVTKGLVLETGLMFEPGKAVLKPSGRQVLDRVQTELNTPEYATHKIRVDGHTDDTPIRRSKNASNWELSSKRALTVLHYLEENGIDPERLSFAGYGPFQPMELGENKAVRQKNRRVEIVLFEGE